MSRPVTVQLRVPDLGDFEDVEVIEILVAPGDAVLVEDPLLTLETDKASMDIPASQAGTIVSVDVKVGDKVSTGSVVVTIETAGSESDVPVENVEETRKMSAPEIVATRAHEGDATHAAQLVVIGAGPGGYTAAFRAADLGLNVILIERSPVLGGVCLNVGCIPSKALLHAAKVIDDVAAMAEHGVTFGKPRIEAEKLRDWKNQVIGQLTSGLSTMAKQRKVRVIQGTASFVSAHRLKLDNDETVEFEQCIIAAGSEPLMLPGLPDDPRIVDSTGALELVPLPKRLLVVGGGIIGLEMACVYSALGTDVSVVELTDSLMPGTDPDLLRPFLKIVKKRYEAIMVSTRVTGMRATVPGIEVSFEGDKAPSVGVYDRVLVAVGRKASGGLIDADKAGVNVDAHGIMKSYFDARTIPSVAYTDPEIAWVGLTELEAKAQGVEYEKAQFPWAASGRALALGRSEGFTKLLFDKQTKRVLGGAIVGPNAGDLVAEIGLAIEMGADAADVSLTIHPHPTLSETVAMAAEAFEGTLTDLYIPKRR